MKTLIIFILSNKWLENEVQSPAIILIIPSYHNSSTIDHALPPLFFFKYISNLLLLTQHYLS